MELTIDERFEWLKKNKPKNKDNYSIRKKYNYMNYPFYNHNLTSTC